MALRVVWTKEAEDQLDEIIAYLESNWTNREISNFFERLEKSINQIRTNPNTFKNSERKPNTKEFQLSKQTTLFYSFDERTVNILLLWSNRMNPEDLKN